jgi:hypothetical protein
MALLRPAPSRSLALAAVIGLFVTAVTPRVTAQGRPPAIEANVKAVFLFNFIKYVAWPSRADGEQPSGDLQICVTANDEFYALLKATVEGEEIDGRPLVAVALQGLDDAKSCHLLYVGDVKSPDARAWLNAVRGREVLTVADGGLSDDTVIAFVRDSSRVRFDINRASAGRRNLTVSAKLLRLARQVRPE